jgi:uncharacterized protein YcbK (DUF882 family)
MRANGPFEPTQAETNNATQLPSLGRRTFLRAGLAAAGLGATLGTGLIPARSAFAALPPAGERTLAFYNTHTDEKLKATWWRGNAADRGALKDINHILRDFRSGDVHPIDVNLLDLLTELHQRTGSRQPFQIISGYRSPKTNATLAAESNGVAKHSMHLEGKAIDIRLADVKLRDLRNTAVAMKRGGVGIYTQSDFVHVDTGRVRTW